MSIACGRHTFYEYSNNLITGKGEMPLFPPLLGEILGPVLRGKPKWFITCFLGGVLSFVSVLFVYFFDWRAALLLFLFPTFTAYFFSFNLENFLGVLLLLMFIGWNEGYYLLFITVLLLGVLLKWDFHPFAFFFLLINSGVGVLDWLLFFSFVFVYYYFYKVKYTDYWYHIRINLTGRCSSYFTTFKGFKEWLVIDGARLFNLFVPLLAYFFSFMFNFLFFVELVLTPGLVLYWWFVVFGKK